VEFEVLGTVGDGTPRRSGSFRDRSIYKERTIHWPASNATQREAALLDVAVLLRTPASGKELDAALRRAMKA